MSGKNKRNQSMSLVPGAQLGLSPLCGLQVYIQGVYEDFGIRHISKNGKFMFIPYKNIPIHPFPLSPYLSTSLPLSLSLRPFHVSADLISEYFFISLFIS